MERGRGAVVEVAPTPGTPASWRDGDLAVEIRNLPHGPARTQPANLAHVIEIGGRTVVHVGDAEGKPAQIAAAGLAGRRYDVGLLPSWYWLDDRWRPARDALSGTLGTVALHIPPGEERTALAGVDPAPHIFLRPLDSKRF